MNLPMIFLLDSPVLHPTPQLPFFAQPQPRNIELLAVAPTVAHAKTPGPAGVAALLRGGGPSGDEPIDATEVGIHLRGVFGGEATWAVLAKKPGSIGVFGFF